MVTVAGPGSIGKALAGVDAGDAKAAELDAGDAKAAELDAGAAKLVEDAKTVPELDAEGTGTLDAEPAEPAEAAEAAELDAEAPELGG